MSLTYAGSAIDVLIRSFARPPGLPVRIGRVGDLEVVRQCQDGRALRIIQILLLVGCR
jgi:hypothetical protein